MEFEWDEAKRLANLAKRGVDLVDAALIFEGSIVTRQDGRTYDGEVRWVAVGFADDQCLEVVFPYRGMKVRLISAWNGGRDAQRRYQNRDA